MKIISWNIRGLNSPHKQDVLRNLVREHKPDIVIIQETKMNKEKVEKIKLFKDGEVFSGISDGASGGIAIFWNLRRVSGEPVKQDINLDFIRFHHIGDGTSLLLTNIYAPNNRFGRRKFWKKLEAIRVLYKEDMWIVMGDFNTPLQDNEKFGGVPSQLESRMVLLNFINNQGLHDIELQGAKFTWMNRRMGDDLIQVRLDRALICNEWFNHYQCSLFAISRIGYDHFLVIFVADNIIVKRNFSFRFERMWLDHPNLVQVIEKWWSIDVKGTAMYRIAKKLRNVKDNIKKWNKDVFRDLFAAKTKTELKLKEMHDKIQMSRYNEVSISEENEVLVKYHKIIIREEEFWKQRSRSLWLKVGDKNTRFFHMTAMKYKAANRISMLKIGETEMRKDDEIKKEARNFFTSLLLANSGLDGQSQSAILENIPSNISEDQNKALVAIPSEEEVKK
ncbi:uncharacterized protein LOC131858218 [Cryptomeria japonica]|uniref:uncharacterized protein LOC131858218 n=1 Tax=Cryptomeria japonica TaxID=3369 RepID=UPI0027DA0B81|nr:uncharacterized protein LOC131858218 [Cryptomeria japonica]